MRPKDFFRGQTRIFITQATLNTNDARFLRCEQKICEVLQGMLGERRDISPTDICKMIGISRTTFYAHFGPKDIVQQYELRLKIRFLDSLPKARLRKEVIFALLLKFVRKERRYFESTVPNANFWLLKEIFAELQPILAKGITQKTYDVYVMQQIALIASLVQYEKCAEEKLEAYVRKMVYVNVMRVD